MRSITWVGAGVCLLVLFGCNWPFASDRVCTSESRAGIEIRPLDELTGLPADGNGMIVLLKDGDYLEELVGPPLNGTFEGARERPGIYSISITSPSYVTWRQNGVRVREGACHVETVHVTADLTRAVTG